MERALAIGDRAPGTDVLQSLYQEMRDKPDPVDLDQLWQKVGVALKDGEVVFNDHAVDAAIRTAVVSPPSLRLTLAAISTCQTLPSA
jgi:hypothetical protein